MNYQFLKALLTLNISLFPHKKSFMITCPRENGGFIVLKPLSRLPLRFASGTMSPKGEKLLLLKQESLWKFNQTHQSTSPLPIWEGRGDRSQPTRRLIVTIGRRTELVEVVMSHFTAIAGQKISFSCRHWH